MEVKQLTQAVINKFQVIMSLGLHFALGFSLDFSFFGIRLFHHVCSKYSERTQASREKQYQIAHKIFLMRTHAVY